MPNRDKEYKRIWNDSDSDYREKFRDEEIVIPARGSIVMGRRKAVEFLSHFVSYDKDNPDKFSKPLRAVAAEKPEKVVAAKENEDNEEKNRCVICGKTFQGEKRLSSHIKKAHQGLPAATKPGD